VLNEGASETLPAGRFAVETFGSEKEPPCSGEPGAGMTPPASAGAGADNGGRYVESWFIVEGGSVSAGN
jgi:hypothetical protein